MAKVLIDLANSEPYFHYPPELYQRLCKAFPEHTLVYVGDKAQRDHHLPDADVYLGWRLDAEMLEAARRLKWVMFAGADVGGRLLGEMKTQGIVITDSAGVRARSAAEHAFALILTFSRRLIERQKFQDAHRWGRDEMIRMHPLPTELEGHTIVVVGYGHLGSRVARIAKHGFDMRVRVVRRNAETPAPDADEVLPGTPAGLALAVRDANVVVLCLPHTRKTVRMIDNTIISGVKPGALLVNVGSPEVVDHTAILAAVRLRRLGGVALDVFPEEPLPESDPLWELDHVVISCHYAGVTPHLWPLITDLFSRNFRRFLAGDPLENMLE